MRDQRGVVWDHILDTDRAVRYCSAQEGRFRFRHRLLSFLTAIAASGGMASVLVHAPGWVSALVLFVTAATALWLAFADYSGKAAKAEAAADQLNILAIEWRELWFSMEIPPNRVRELATRYAHVSGWYSIESDDRLNQRVQEEAYEAITNEFAV